MEDEAHRSVNLAWVLVLTAALFGLPGPNAAGDTSAGGGEQVADGPGPPLFLQVNGYRFDPLREMPPLPTGLRFQAAEADSPYRIVQFEGPITESWRARLEQAGATPLHYLSENAFVVRAVGEEGLAELPGVRWVGPFEPAFKLSPRLAAADADGDDPKTAPGRFDGSVLLAGRDSQVVFPGPPRELEASERLPSAPAPPSNRLRVLLLPFEPHRVREVVDAARALGGSDLTGSEGRWGTVRGEIDRDALTALARHPAVMWIDRESQPYVFNDLARWVIQSGDATSRRTPIHDRGLRGAGQVVTVADTGLDYDHPAFADPAVPAPGPGHRKVSAYYVPTNATGDATDIGINHGTHVAGSVAGDDGTWGTYDGDATGSGAATGAHDGQAFAASLQVQDISLDGNYVLPPPDLHDMYRDALSRGSWIHTNSWGLCCGDYIAEAAQTDDFVWQNPDFVVLYAAGNRGPERNTTNSYGLAKNAITVGATVNGEGMDAVAPFSSRGPGPGGRLKPDVMAPGVEVWSAAGCDFASGCDPYMELSGTSMATPAVAGAAALVREYYLEGWYPTGTDRPADALVPSAALVKATLIHAAAEMNGAGAYGNDERRYPNVNQGWGRPVLDDALFFAGDGRSLFADDARGGLGTGGVASYSTRVGDGAVPLEITLVWSDYPGLPMAGNNLVNDLDLVAIAPDGTVYRGNNFTGHDPGESFPGGAAVDRTNNVESVLVVTNPQRGVWTLEVRGFSVPFGPQPYALVVSGSLAGSRGVVRWDREAYRSTATATVDVVDTDLDTTAAADTATVLVQSATESAGESLTLTETGGRTAVFAGAIGLENSATPVPGDGLLQVRPGDLLTAVYLDTDDGLGSSGLRLDNASVDDAAPGIADVRVIDVRFNRATVEWTTDEAGDSLVRYGPAPPPASIAADSRRVSAHATSLRGLTPSTTYYLVIESVDAAGNTATDDNASAYYQFTTPPKPAEAPASDEWPAFANNRQRLGASPGPLAPPLTLRWASGENLAGRWTSPVLAEGVLYAATMDGFLRARDPSSGDVLWERQLGDKYFYPGTPTVEGGVVYAGFSQASGGLVHALDAVRGTPRWVVGPESGLDIDARVALAVADGLVFGSTWDGGLFALDAANGSVAWTSRTFTVPAGGPAVEFFDLPIGGLAVGLGQVVMGTTGGTVVALDELTGEILWTQEVVGTIRSHLVLAQDRVFVATASGSVHALDAFTGSEVWRRTGLVNVIFSGPAFDGARLYFGSYDGRAYHALNAADGSVAWQTPIGSTIQGAVAYANGRVYGAAIDGFLRTLDAGTGAVVDAASIGTLSYSAPAVAGGWLWIEDASGEMHGFLGQIAAGCAVRPPFQFRDAAPGSAVDYGLAVENLAPAGSDTFDITAVGSLGWAVSLFEADGVTPLSDTDGDAVPDTGPLASGATRDVVVRVAIPPGALGGEEEASRVTFVSSNDPSQSSDARLLTRVPAAGVDLGNTVALELASGDPAVANLTVRNTGGLSDTLDITWSSDPGWDPVLFASDGVTSLADTDGDLVPDTGVVAGLGAAGIVVRVSIPPGAPFGTMGQARITGTSSLDPLAADTVTVLVERLAPPSRDWPQFLHDRERSGGAPEPFALPLTLRWTAHELGRPLTVVAPIVVNHTVYLSETEGNLVALDLGSGEVRWRTPLGDFGSPATGPAYENGTLYAAFVTRGRRAVTMYAVEEATGAVLWEHQVPADNWGAFTNPVVAAGAVYWSDSMGGHVFATDAATGAGLWSYRMTDYVFAGPTYGRGAAYVGDNRGTLAALDALTGETWWTRSLGSSIWGAPTFSAGVVYAGTMSGSVHALDARTGGTLWTATGLGSVRRSPLLAGGFVLVAANVNGSYGGVLALDPATGGIVWSSTAPGQFSGSLAYNNGTVFAANMQGSLHAWDAATGGVRQVLPLAPYSMSSPAIASGYLLVGDDSGLLSAFSFAGAGDVRRIEVTPTAANLTVTDVQVFEARALDEFNNTVPGVNFTWSSVGGLGAVVPLSPSGDRAVYTAGTLAGAEVLEVTSSSLRTSAAITIAPGPVDRVDVSPPAASVPVGGTLAFTATATDRFGNSIPNATFSWSVTGVTSTVDATGVFTAGTAIGSGTVVATFGGVEGAASVEVIPGGIASLAVTPSPVSATVATSMILRAEGYDAYGNAVGGLTYNWSASIGDITRMPPGGESAVFDAGFLAGSGTVTASSGGVSVTVPVTVWPGPVSWVLVAPGSAAVLVGGAVSFTATATDLFGNAIPNATLAWSVTGVTGTIDPSGRFTAGTAVGSGTVVAAFGGVEGTATIEIIPGPLGTIQITPSPIAVSVAASAFLLAEGFDAYGNVLSGLTYEWSSTIGSVSLAFPGGEMALLDTGFVAGSGVITVTSGSVTVNVPVTVAPGAVSELLVAPDPAAVEAGGTVAFTATATDLFGNVLTGLALVWSASPSAGTITPSGLLTAATAVGAGNVTVSSGVASRTVAVTVLPGPPAMLAVNPDPLTLAAGSSAILTAQVRDAYGNAIPGTAVAWSADAGTVMVVTAEGTVAQYTAPTTAGPFLIDASAGGVSTSIAVTVLPGPLAFLVVTPSAATVAAGGDATLQAQAADAYGNEIPAAVIGWSADRGTITPTIANGTVAEFTAPTLAGPALITATAEAVARLVVITVVAGPVATVSVTPTTATILAGSTLAFFAQAWDAHGNEVVGEPVVWSATAGEIDADGSFTAPVEPGRVTVSASVADQRGEVVVVVFAAGGDRPVDLLPLVLALAVGVAILLVLLYRERRSRTRTRPPVGAHPEADPGLPGPRVEEDHAGEP